MKMKKVIFPVLFFLLLGAAVAWAITINNLPPAAPITGSEQLMLWQNGKTVQASLTAVKSAVSNGVSSFNGRTGAVTPASGDYNFSEISGTLAASQMPGVINSTFQGSITGVSLTSPPSAPATGDYKFYFNSATGHWYGISNSSGTLSGPTQIDGTSLTAPLDVASVHATGLANNVSSTTLYTVSNSGLYTVSAYDVIAQIANGTGSTVPSLSIGYTNPAGSDSFQVISTNLANSLAYGKTGSATFYAVTGSAITYYTSGYASNGGTPMEYELDIKLTQLP